ncbi:MAG: hypothetical protein LCI00_17785 [Chloroflexi bacterium]|nr:hypothetical protein [Chloroflexota bacterium]MCC6893827.1 PD40 domain-containing protein [Anaerolineae bacterium]
MRNPFSRIFQMLLLLIALLPSTLAAQNSPTDLLAYTTTVDGNTQLMLYDTATEQTRIVVENISGFEFHSSGKVAYTVTTQNPSALYVLDALAPNATPISISQSTTGQYMVWNWSRDGKYLAYEVRTDQDYSIFIWDGESSVEISQEPVSRFGSTYWYETSWSQDNKLAFTVADSTSGNTEIFVWDGTKIFNVSQNQLRRNSSPHWSADGRLAFLSGENVSYGKYDILVWDGKSFKNGLPDRDTFIHLSSELINYLSRPHWNDDGDLEFFGWGENDKQGRIYVWDGEDIVGSTYRMTADDKFIYWSPNGQWANVVTTALYRTTSFLTLVDKNNEVVLEVEAEYMIWSANSLLAFCSWEPQLGWVLSIWDGKTITKIAEQRRDFVVQWLGGSSIACSNG